jgi:hypothetical protein
MKDLYQINYRKNSTFLYNLFYEKIRQVVFSTVGTTKLKRKNNLELAMVRYVKKLTGLPCHGLCIKIYYTNSDIKIQIESSHQEASDILYKYDLEKYHINKLRKEKIKEIFIYDRGACELD